MMKNKFLWIFLMFLLLSVFGFWGLANIKNKAVIHLQAESIEEKPNQKSIVIDLHTDALYFHVRGKKDITKYSKILQVDIPRLLEGGVNGQVFAIWPNPKLLKRGQYADFVLSAIDTFSRICRDESSKIAIALSPDDVYKIAKSNRIAGILAIEGGHALEGRLDMLDTFYLKGVRLLTITWNNTNEFADGVNDTIKPYGGLSDLGVKLIKHMNEMGMLIDVSHADENTFWDVINSSVAPVIASHSGVRMLCNNPRNLTDDQVRAIAEKGGVIGVIFYPSLLRTDVESVSIKDVLREIDYIKRLVGVDYIALGSDFDGFMGKPPPIGLEDATKFPALKDSLISREYSDEEIEKILGKNFLRVWQKVCGISRSNSL